MRGNIAATTDSTGAVLNTPSSDGFSSQGGGELCATFGGQVGGYFDVETGLVLFGQRYYDSALGSWLTRDPIAEAGGVNLYSYVKGNPVNATDEYGLRPGRTYGPPGLDPGVDGAGGGGAGAGIGIISLWGIYKYFTTPEKFADSTAGPKTPPTTTKIPPTPQPLNQMRVQIQRGRNHYGSIVLTAPSSRGVSSAQVLKALDVMRNNPAIPRGNSSQNAANNALARAKRFVTNAVPAGVTTTFSRSFYFNNNTNDFRFDVENLRGHNLRC